MWRPRLWPVHEVIRMHRAHGNKTAQNSGHGGGSRDDATTSWRGRGRRGQSASVRGEPDRFSGSSYPGPAIAGSGAARARECFVFCSHAARIQMDAASPHHTHAHTRVGRIFSFARAACVDHGKPRCSCVCLCNLGSPGPRNFHPSGLCALYWQWRSRRRGRAGGLS